MHTNQISIVGRLSLVALGIIGIALLNPSSPITSFATDDAGSERMASGASSIAVSLGDQADMAVLPTAAGSLATTSTDLIILATNTVDYKLYISPVDKVNTSLTPVDLSNEHTIEPISSSTVLANFPANTWGYSLVQSEPDGNTLYQPLVSSSDPVKEVTTETDTTDRYKLSFGVKVDNSLPAGFYTNKVIASVVATPVEVAVLNTLSDIDYMQEMTSTICENSNEHETKQLIDNRDGKSYWVAKLKDGNCWMTQNLALYLDVNAEGNAVAVSEDGGKTELDQMNTDILNVWKPISTSTFKTNSIELTGVEIGSSSENQFSWSWGKVVLATPLLVQDCREIKSSDDLATKCKAAGFVDVSGTGWRATFEAKAGSFNGVSHALVAANAVTKRYDAHYLIGNYYSWGTVTAGYGASLSAINEVAISSICPQGWMLPASALDDGKPSLNPNQAKASFYQLLLAYGYPDTDGYTLDGFTSHDTKILNPKIMAEDNPASAPMSFVRSGFVSKDEGILKNAGTYGYYASSSFAFSNTNSLLFWLSSTNVSPASSVAMGGGQLVRCVAR